MISDAADRRKLASMLHLGTVRLRTERLDLLPIDRTHAEGLFTVLKDPSLYEFTGGKPPIDASSLARTYEYWETRASPDGTELWFNWAVSLRVHQLLIGYVQAGIHSDYADMAWVVGSEWQQQGYATRLQSQSWNFYGKTGFGVSSFYRSAHHRASGRTFKG